MDRIKHLLAAAVVMCSAGPAAQAHVGFDWALIGNAGNAADPATGVGAVDYEYRIARHEVTNGQYAEFLNAVDPTGANSLQLYDNAMSGNFGGIVREPGNAPGSRYVAQAARRDNPVTQVSFLDAMRFVNWLSNGQGDADTESGVYAVTNGLAETRSGNARYFIPDRDEWYKAAYHDKSAGTAGQYFKYATGSDDVPVSDRPDDDPAAVNYYNDDGQANGVNDGYAVSGSTDYPDTTNPFNDVGAYEDAASPYGTFDQNGNAWEWNETLVTSTSRGIYGGSWDFSEGGLRSTSNLFSNPAVGGNTLGFRIGASVPEPGTAWGIVGLGLMMLTRRGAAGRRG